MFTHIIIKISANNDDPSLGVNKVIGTKLSINYLF